MVHGACQNLKLMHTNTVDRRYYGAFFFFFFFRILWCTVRAKIQERVGTKRAIFGNGKCELQRHNGETGSVKGETKSAIFGKGKVNSQQLCEFLAWESVNSSPILARQ